MESRAWMDTLNVHKRKSLDVFRHRPGRPPAGDGNLLIAAYPMQRITFGERGSSIGGTRGGKQMRSLKDWRTRTFATVVVLAFLAGAWVVAVPNKAPSAAVGGIGSAGLGTRDLDVAPKPVTSTQELGEETSQAGANLVSTLQLDEESSAAESLPEGFIAPQSVAEPRAKTSTGAFLSAPGEEGPKSDPIGTRGDQGLTVNLASLYW